jgi:uncharacterized RmlC-like cupin family protein
MVHVCVERHLSVSGQNQMRFGKLAELGDVVNNGDFTYSFGSTACPHMNVYGKLSSP